MSSAQKNHHPQISSQVFPLRIDQVNKTFDLGIQEASVLSDVSAEINKGEFVILFGPSGCGKSTVLHVLLGLEKPTSGTVYYGNTDIYTFSEDERAQFRKRSIGMVYQLPNWVKAYSVVENIMFPALLIGASREQARERAHELLKFLDLEKWAEYSPTELSVGQQQRVSLLRALMNDPDILIADEPTGNLDYEASTEIMTLFQELNRDAGKTIILVTHERQQLLFGQRGLRMLDGKIVEELKTNQALKEYLSRPEIHPEQLHQYDTQKNKQKVKKVAQ